MAQRPRRGVSEGDRLARAEGAEGPVGCGHRAVAAEEALTRFEVPGRLDGAGPIESKETREFDMTNALRNVLVIGSIAMFGGCAGMNALTSTLEEAQGQRARFRAAQR